MGVESMRRVSVPVAAVPKGTEKAVKEALIFVLYTTTPQAGHPVSPTCSQKSLASCAVDPDGMACLFKSSHYRHSYSIIATRATISPEDHNTPIPLKGRRTRTKSKHYTIVNVHDKLTFEVAKILSLKMSEKPKGMQATFRFLGWC